ncbi:hypothetical protein KIH78_01835 [Bifidobacterium sp. 79T10]|nr:hypothetical protein [Bifidobacterium saguinibicoloris]MBW3080151.1 hypothetical protein [Bifidobacterium saguinibicoloris]
MLLDAAGAMREGHEAALALLAGGHDALLAISPGSLKDFYYIAGRAKAGIGGDGGMSDKERRGWMRLFLDATVVVPEDRRMVLASLDSDESDYEDATKRVAAEGWHADWIITRDSNRHAFERSSIPATTVVDILTRL